MAKTNKEKFEEFHSKGDVDGLVNFARNLPNCPYCDKEWEIKNNDLICDGCGFTILNLDPPSPLSGSKGVW